MRSTSIRGWRGHVRTRRLGATTALLAAVTALAALPTAPAGASSISISSVPTAEVQALLSKTPLQALPATALGQVLGKLPAFAGLEPAVLEAALTEAVEDLQEAGSNIGGLLNPSESAALLETELKEALGPLAPQLEEMLGGEPLVKLAEALESSSPQQLVGELLKSSPEPQKLIAELLGSLNPATLEKLLGALPTGGPFSLRTVEQLASELGITRRHLTEQLSSEAGELPAEAAALTKPLSNGTTVGVVETSKGVAIGVLGEASDIAKGGGSGGAGGPGGPGGSGAGSPPKGTAAGAVGKAFKIKVLSHRVRHRIATIVVQVPSAGTLSLSGKGVRSAHQKPRKAGRVTIRGVLSRAGTAALRRSHSRHRHLRVPVKLTFKPSTGAGSSATVPVAFG